MTDLRTNLIWKDNRANRIMIDKAVEFYSLKDKVIIVTGSSSGIGLEIARLFSLKGATIIVACRDDKRGVETVNIINNYSEYINLDLSSFISIDRFVKTVQNKYSKVDILINNAGVMAPPFLLTYENLEMTFGVNYIGYYLLTNKLMPMMREVKHSRVVNMSSIAQYKVQHIAWENINSQMYYDKWESYALSNLFRVMFTLELDKKLRAKGYETLALACHPGVTMTNLIRYMPRLLRSSMLARIMNYLIFQTPHQAAIPAIIAATSPNVDGGDFIGLDTKRQIRGNPAVVKPNELVFDQALREQLWDESVNITGMDLE